MLSLFKLIGIKKDLSFCFVRKTVEIQKIRFILENEVFYISNYFCRITTNNFSWFGYAFGNYAARSYYSIVRDSYTIENYRLIAYKTIIPYGYFATHIGIFLSTEQNTYTGIMC